MSCLFRSLSYFHDLDENQMRSVICNYLSNDPLMNGMKASESIQWEFGSNTPLCDYVKRMRNRSTWGGALEIKAYCELFKVSVDVHIKNTQTHIEFINSENRNMWIEIEWNGYHYEPIWNE